VKRRLFNLAAAVSLVMAMLPSHQHALSVVAHIRMQRLVQPHCLVATLEV
jgi:hypothetical protein